jgi:hypothetical protein
VGPERHAHGELADFVLSKRCNESRNNDTGEMVLTCNLLKSGVIHVAFQEIFSGWQISAAISFEPIRRPITISFAHAYG